MAKTAEEKKAEKEAIAKHRREIMEAVAAGRMTVEEAEKALTEKPAAHRKFDVRKSDDGLKVLFTGCYARHPITFYAEHLVRYADEGVLERAVALARELVKEIEAKKEKGEGEKTPDEPPADEAPALDGDVDQLEKEAAAA